jgi:predicted ArsR family transcriptional regulator
MALTPLTKYRKISYVALAKTMKLLMDGPATAHEVSEVTGIHVVTAQEWMRSLHKEGCVHIGGWIHDSLGRDTTAVYHLGKGLDKPRHKFTPAERQARHRARKRQAHIQSIITGVTTHDQG